jgi:glycerol-3-phosphate dehydrogenase (NAD(P)+)
MVTRIAVLGAGSWGTALAAVLADRGHAVVLWGRNAAHLDELRRAHENRRYLPGRKLPPSLEPTADLESAVAGRALVVFALPAATVREVATRAIPHVSPDAILVCASKGLEENSGLTLDRVLARVAPALPIVLLSGPSFAAEVAQGLPAALVAASIDAVAAQTVQRVVASERLRIYTSDDVLGVAIAGALKNVIAIAAGCADGMGVGHNARAALITRGLHEIGRLIERLGGNPLTVAGLAGLGDLVLTCTGDLSRNRKVGLALARGESVPAILQGLGQVAEGIHTARIAHDLSVSLGVEMPITAAVAAVLAGVSTAREAVADLLARELGPERA